MVFAGYSSFLHYLQLASHELATIGINVKKNKIQIQTQTHHSVSVPNTHCPRHNIDCNQYILIESCNLPSVDSN